MDKILEEISRLEEETEKLSDKRVEAINKHDLVDFYINLKRKEIADTNKEINKHESKKRVYANRYALYKEAALHIGQAGVLSFIVMSVLSALAIMTMPFYSTALLLKLITITAVMTTGISGAVFLLQTKQVREISKKKNYKKTIDDLSLAESKKNEDEKELQNLIETKSSLKDTFTLAIEQEDEHRHKIDELLEYRECVIAEMNKTLTKEQIEKCENSAKVLIKNRSK